MGIISTEAIEEQDTSAAEQAAEVFETSLKESGAQKVNHALAERRLFREHDLTYVDRTVSPPVEKIDPGELDEVIFGIIAAAEVSSREDLDTVPVTKDKLVKGVLNQCPAPGDDEWEKLDADTREGWKLARARVWARIQTKPNAKMQRLARERRGEAYVVVREADAVYATREPKFVRQALLLPMLDEWESKGTAIGTAIGMFASYNPALRARASR